MRLMRSWKFWCVAAAVVSVLMAFYLLAGAVLYDDLSRIAICTCKDNGQSPAAFSVSPEQFPDFDASPYFVANGEHVECDSRQPGIALSGIYMKTAEDSPTVLLVHGFNDCKLCPCVLVPAGMLYRAGFNCLVIDVREHGESTIEDGRTSLGNEEYLDVLGAWDWLVEDRGHAPRQVGIFGVSLGAATALIAAGQEPRVGAVFLDSPFSSLEMVIREELTRNGFPTFISHAGIFMAWLISGDDLLAHSPEIELLNLGARPLYLTHSRSDERVAFHHSERLARIAIEHELNVTTWFVDNVGHTKQMLKCPTEYQSRLVRFFRESLDGR